ncbi:MAG: mechanosensitive ion channel family protein [Acidimicrobiia bacterium]|jgi:miniconductance mechanosensitive channel
MSDWGETAIGVGAAVGVAVLVYVLLRTRILRVLEREIVESPVRWDDALLRRRVPQRVALLLPAVLAFVLVQLAPDDEPDLVVAAERILLAVVVLLSVFVISAVLNATDEIYEMHYDPTRNRPIKGYLQIVNTLVFLGGTILIVAILADKSPLVLLGGLGALTAILLLVFQDTITGFVASVQLQNYDVVRQGDWIEAPEYGADGEVVDVTLHTVKILNADRTMVTIPTSKLTQGGFTNWRPIYEGGGRRIMRSIRLDVSMVRFLTGEEVDRLRRWELLHDWLEACLDDLESQAAHDASLPDGVVAHRRGITNIGAFRAYAEAYVRRHPRIHGDGGDMTALVRVKEATPDGVPVEVYAFARETGFEAFEEVQAEIFDHLLAVVPEFGLRVFQNPTGADMARLAGATPELSPVDGHQGGGPG